MPNRLSQWDLDNLNPDEQSQTLLAYTSLPLIPKILL